MKSESLENSRAFLHASREASRIKKAINEQAKPHLMEFRKESRSHCPRMSESFRAIGVHHMKSHAKSNATE